MLVLKVYSVGAVCVQCWCFVNCGMTKASASRTANYSILFLFSGNCPILLHIYNLIVFVIIIIYI